MIWLHLNNKLLWLEKTDKNAVNLPQLISHSKFLLVTQFHYLNTVVLQFKTESLDIRLMIELRINQQLNSGIKLTLILSKLKK